MALRTSATVGTSQMAFRVAICAPQRNFSSDASYSWKGGRSSVSGVRATVFGCSGFVGRYVVNRLGRLGTQCVLPYRGDGMNVRHLKLMGDLGQMVPLPYDLSSPDTIKRVVDRSNVVINLIGNMHQTRNYNYHDTHVKVTHRICKVAAESGTVDKFIHVSAYGADHNSPSEFLRTKAAGEDAVRDFFPNATIIRPTQIFGHEDKFINRYANFMNLTMMIPVLSPQGKVQPVFVQDVAQAIVNAIAATEAPGKIYNLAGPDVFTYEQLMEIISKEIVRPDCFVQEVPHFAARLIGQVLEKTLPVKWRVMTPDLVDQMLVNLTVKPQHNGLTQLQVPMTALMRELSALCIAHSGDRVPYRFETKYQNTISAPR